MLIKFSEAEKICSSPGHTYWDVRTAVKDIPIRDCKHDLTHIKQAPHILIHTA